LTVELTFLAGLIKLNGGFPAQTNGVANIALLNNPTMAPGSYSVEVLVNDPVTSCSDIATKTFSIAPLPDAPTVTNLAESYCFVDSSSALVGQPTGGVFSGQGMIGNLFDPSLFVNSQIDRNFAQTFSVSYTITDGATGCKNSQVAISVFKRACSTIEMHFFDYFL
jgi:hypothetical protein